MKYKITVSLFHLSGFAFSLVCFGLVTGFAIANHTHPIWPLVLTAIGLAIASASVVMTSKLTSD